LRADLRLPGLPRRRVLAAVVTLLDRTRARIGNDEYARQNRSFGLTTLRDGHAAIGEGVIRLAFRGKSGGQHDLRVVNDRLARVVGRCQELPGQRLFQYLDERGRRRPVGSADVNHYLREICGDACSAKDFRTWHGSVGALQALRRTDPSASRERAVVEVVESVARSLGNTRAVCRKFYIAPAVIEAFLANELPPPPPRGASGLSLAEHDLLALLASSRTSASARAA
jgi:DNA topoisomerase-1